MLNRIATVMIYGARLAPLCIPINAKSWPVITRWSLETFMIHRLLAKNGDEKLRRRLPTNFDLINPATNATLDSHSCTKLILAQ